MAHRILAPMLMYKNEPSLEDLVKSHFLLSALALCNYATQEEIKQYEINLNQQAHRFHFETQLHEFCQNGEVTDSMGPLLDIYTSELVGRLHRLGKLQDVAEDCPIHHVVQAAAMEIPQYTASLREERRLLDDSEQLTYAQLNPEDLARGRSIFHVLLHHMHQRQGAVDEGDVDVSSQTVRSQVLSDTWKEILYASDFLFANPEERPEILDTEPADMDGLMQRYMAVFGLTAMEKLVDLVHHMQFCDDFGIPPEEIPDDFAFHEDFGDPFEFSLGAIEDQE